jgi:hypothetical protein
MSGQLSHRAPAQPPPVEQRSTSRRVVIDVVAILMVFAVAGAACGFLWERIWTAPTGAAYQHRWLLDGHGLPEDFSGTGLYVLIAASAGLVLGLVLTLFFDNDEVASLAAIIVGSVLAAYLMWVVGSALGPPDPHAIARTADDLDPIPADLSVHGKSPWLAFPLGALVSAAAVLFLFSRRRSQP